MPRKSPPLATFLALGAVFPSLALGGCISDRGFGPDNRPFTGKESGILIGAGIGWAVRTFIPALPTYVSLFWVAMGVLMAAGVGLFFGYYPARRAANLDPIICLRYE